MPIRPYGLPSVRNLSDRDRAEGTTAIADFIVDPEVAFKDGFE
jgi:hypothetical protein